MMNEPRAADTHSICPRDVNVTTETTIEVDQPLATVATTTHIQTTMNLTLTIRKCFTVNVLAHIRDTVPIPALVRPPTIITP